MAVSLVGWEQGLQGELQAASMLIAEGERPQGQGKLISAVAE